MPQISNAQNARKRNPATTAIRFQMCLLIFIRVWLSLRLMRQKHNKKQCIRRALGTLAGSRLESPGATDTLLLDRLHRSLTPSAGSVPEFRNRLHSLTSCSSKRTPSPGVNPTSQLIHTFSLPPRRLPASLVQRRQKPPPVEVRRENRRPLIPPGHHMAHRARKLDPHLACYVARIPPPPGSQSRVSIRGPFSCRMSSPGPNAFRQRRGGSGRGSRRCQLSFQFGDERTVVGIAQSGLQRGEESSACYRPPGAPAGRARARESGDCARHRLHRVSAARVCSSSSTHQSTAPSSVRQRRYSSTPARR